MIPSLVFQSELVRLRREVRWCLFELGISLRSECLVFTLVVAVVMLGSDAVTDSQK